MVSLTVGLLAAVVVDAARVEVQYTIEDTFEDTFEEIQPACDWPEELTDKGYTNPAVVGVGATACVYIANDEEGVKIAVKVRKDTGSNNAATAWQKECDKMQLIRKRACSMGKEVHELAETFIPTCLGVGTTGATYYVMHAAGTTGIEKITRPPMDTQLTLFGQMVGAMYALHAVGYTHNDLHGQNLVLDDNNRLALIDFGELAPHHSGHGYKHDMNSVWKWTAQLAVCPSDAFPGGGSFTVQRGRKEKFLACLKKNWDVDQDSLDTFDLVLENTILRKKDQMMKELFHTEFVQNLDNKIDSKFAWAKMDGCLDLDWDSIKDVQECTQLPSFVGQCPIESRPGACYNEAGSWSCWTDGVDLWKDQCQEQGYDGACSYKDYGKELKVEELEDCNTLNVCEQQCATKSGMFGACYTEDTSVPQHLQCLCVKASNTWMIKKSFLKGGCQTKRIQGEAKAYTGLCKYTSYSVAAKATTTPPKFNVFGVEVKTTTPVPTVPAGASRPYARGELILVQNSKGKWKQGTVVALGAGKVKIHYDGFSKRFDRFVPDLASTIKKWEEGVVVERPQDALPVVKPKPAISQYVPGTSNYAQPVRTTAATTTTTTSQFCAALTDPANADCAKDVKWAFHSGKKQGWAKSSYGKIVDIAGVSHKDGTLEDYQRLWYCGGVRRVEKCGMPPCTCTNPPCGDC